MTRPDQGYLRGGAELSQEETKVMPRTAGAYLRASLSVPSAWPLGEHCRGTDADTRAQPTMTSILQHMRAAASAVQSPATAFEVGAAAVRDNAAALTRRLLTCGADFACGPQELCGGASWCLTRAASVMWAHRHPAMKEVGWQRSAPIARPSETRASAWPAPTKRVAT